MAAQLTSGLWGRPTAASALRLPAPAGFVGNDTATKVAMKSRTCLVEIVATESEPTEVMFSKFSSAIRRTGMYFEVKRRQRFECKQDRIKRKRKEKPFKKRIRYIPTYAKSGSVGFSVPPFADLFHAPEDDIFAQAPFLKSHNGQGRNGGNQYRPHSDGRRYQARADGTDDGVMLGLQTANDDSKKVELAGSVDRMDSG